MKKSFVHFIIQKYESAQYIIAVLKNKKQADKLVLKYQKQKICPEFEYSVKTMELVL